MDKYMYFKFYVRYVVLTYFFMDGIINWMQKIK